MIIRRLVMSDIDLGLIFNRKLIGNFNKLAFFLLLIMSVWVVYPKVSDASDSQILDDYHGILGKHTIEQIEVFELIHKGIFQEGYFFQPKSRLHRDQSRKFRADIVEKNQITVEITEASWLEGVRVFYDFPEDTDWTNKDNIVQYQTIAGFGDIPLETISDDYLREKWSQISKNGERVARCVFWNGHCWIVKENKRILRVNFFSWKEDQVLSLLSIIEDELFNGDVVEFSGSVLELKYLPINNANQYFYPKFMGSMFVGINDYQRVFLTKLEPLKIKGKMLGE